MFARACIGGMLMLDSGARSRLSVFWQVHLGQSARAPHLAPGCQQLRRRRLPSLLQLRLRLRQLPRLDHRGPMAT
jgi:hypothetical protein